MAARHSAVMAHFLVTVVASLAAAVVFTLSIPADSAMAEWELPFSAGR